MNLSPKWLHRLEAPHTSKTYSYRSSEYRKVGLCFYNLSLLLRGKKGPTRNKMFWQLDSFDISFIPLSEKKYFISCSIICFPLETLWRIMSHPYSICKAFSPLGRHEMNQLGSSKSSTLLSSFGIHKVGALYTLPYLILRIYSSDWPDSLPIVYNWGSMSELKKKVSTHPSCIYFILWSK